MINLRIKLREALPLSAMGILFSSLLVFIQFAFLDKSLSLLQNFVSLREGNVVLSSGEFQTEVVLSTTHLWAVVPLISWLVMRDLNISLIYEGIRSKNSTFWYIKKNKSSLLYSLEFAFIYNFMLGIYALIFCKEINFKFIFYLLICIVIEFSVIFVFVLAQNIITVFFGYKISLIVILLLMIILSIAASTAEILPVLNDLNVMSHFFISWNYEELSPNSQFLCFGIVGRCVFLAFVIAALLILSFALLKKYDVLLLEKE